MEKELKNFLKSAYILAEKWDETKIKNYPLTLPSFDDLLSELTKIEVK